MIKIRREEKKERKKRKKILYPVSPKLQGRHKRPWDNKQMTLVHYYKTSKMFFIVITIENLFIHNIGDLSCAVLVKMHKRNRV